MYIYKALMFFYLWNIHSKWMFRYDDVIRSEAEAVDVGGPHRARTLQRANNFCL
jgi:hypothetical protein